jgi:CheY-like chemotaxis protein
MDGLETTRRIRQTEVNSDMRRQYASLVGKKAPLRIIGLTANANKKDEEACYAAGMDSFLTKPIVKEKLVTILRDFACDSA